jgi:hypothetical protein
MAAPADPPGKMVAMDGTDATEPGDLATQPAEPAEPATTAPAPVDIGGWPTWLRRTVIAVAMAFGIGVAVWGAQSSSVGDQGNPLDEAIVSLAPRDGAQALRQTSVGAELAPGYDGRLTINGIEIPEDQMDGAIDPSSVTPEQLEQFGIRPNSRNRVFFTPGPGKVIEEYDTGTVAITVRFFEDQLEASTARTVSWQIRVD